MLQKFQKYYLFFALVLTIFSSELIIAQFKIPPKPSKEVQTAVYDYIHILTTSEKNNLKSKLVHYADTTSTQIVIAIISSTNGEDIALLGAKWGQQWGVGQANHDNGIMIILAKDDRTVDINTGYGIEYRITDRMAEQIINRYMIPEFKKGDYYQGLENGTNVMIQMLEGEFKADEKSDFPYTRAITIGLFILFWIIMISASRKGRSGKGGKGGGSIWDVIILSNAGRTGGWSSGSSGGGFSGGFGGGGFGGGGASGSW